MKYRIFNPKTILLIISLSFLLNSCLSIKPSTTKSGKNYFETFYVGKDGVQYFIKPLLFENIESKEDMVVDITFRYKDEIRDSAIVNFSIKSSAIYKNIDSLKVSSKDFKIRNNNVSLLFNEKTKKGFTSRFTTKIALKEIKFLFNENEWNFILYNSTQKNRFKPHRRASKAISTIRDKVFILM